MTTTDLVLFLAALGLILVGVVYLCAWTWHLHGRLETTETELERAHTRIGQLVYRVEQAEHHVEMLGDPA